MEGQEVKKFLLFVCIVVLLLFVALIIIGESKQTTAFKEQYGDDAIIILRGKDVDFYRKVTEYQYAGYFIIDKWNCYKNQCRAITLTNDRDIFRLYHRYRHT